MECRFVGGWGAGDENRVCMYEMYVQLGRIDRRLFKRHPSATLTVCARV